MDLRWALNRQFVGYTKEVPKTALQISQTPQVLSQLAPGSPFVLPICFRGPLYMTRRRRIHTLLSLHPRERRIIYVYLLDVCHVNGHRVIIYPARHS